MKPLAVLVTFASLGYAYPQQAPAVDPGAIQTHDADTFQYEQLEKKLEKLRQQQAAEEAKKSRQAGSNVPAETGPKFLLRHLILNPSELLSQAEIHDVVAKYQGREVSMADLRRLTEEINHLYERKGYVTARAILPAQKIVNGEVKVTLVEGRVGKVSIGSKTRTHDSFILNGVHIKPGQLLRVDELQRNLELLNNTCDLKVKAVLEPGASFGTTDVALQVEAPENQRSTFLFDNAGRTGVGNNRLGFVERYGSVLGLRDPLVLGTYWATGTLDSFLSYNFPVGSWGTRLGANFDYNRIREVSGPTAAFGIEGNSLDTTARISQPLVIRPRLQWSATLSGDYIESHLRSHEVPLTHTVVHSLSWTDDLQMIDHHGVWSTSHILTYGNHDLGGVRPFFKYDGSLVRVENFPKGVIGVLRISGQTNALSYLPPVEQFQAGGLATVRGYPEGRQIDDRGYAGTAELQFPGFFQHRHIRGSALGKKLKEALFFDDGAVYDSYRKLSHPPSDNRYLASVGPGVILNISKYVSGRIDAGFPLRGVEKIPRWRLHFYLQSSPPLVGLLGKAGRAFGPW